MLNIKSVWIEIDNDAGFSHLIVIAIVSIPLKSDKHDLAENCLTLTTNTNTFPCLSHWQFQNVSYSTFMVIHILVGASRYQFLFKQIWYSTFILSKPSSIVSSNSAHADKQTKGKTIIWFTKTLHRKLKTEQHAPHKNVGVMTNFYHTMLYLVHLTMSRIRTHNCWYFTCWIFSFNCDCHSFHPSQVW
jgi:hypothetical protein